MVANKFTTNIYLGSLLILISLIDVFLNSFFKLNLTSFFPGLISLFLPLILGTVGLYLICLMFYFQSNQFSSYLIQSNPGLKEIEWLKNQVKKMLSLF